MAHPVVCKVEGQKVRPKTQIPTDIKGNFAEVEATLTKAEAIAEAKRCTASNPCYYCEVCQLMCPDLAIIRDKETRKIVIDLDFCKGCGLCAHYCPHGAIEMVMEGKQT
jgi:2-oxoacid:acceptor oxidoreductase delta subunit (pyruvate/2-ketoisovalerate family)